MGKIASTITVSGWSLHINIEIGDMANLPVSIRIAWAWQSHVTYTCPRTLSSVVFWIAVTLLLTDVIADLLLDIETESYSYVEFKRLALASSPGSPIF